MTTAADVTAGITDIVLMDACGLADAISTKKLSCVEVMNAYLDHIENLNPEVNAIVALQDRDVLIALAKERDEELARGDIVGILHGFPVAVKDLQPVKGICSTSGSPILKDFIPVQDSLPVTRMRSAGAIFIGKTNVPEFGLGSHTYNKVYGTTRNAYDRSKSAGGSSGGAAVSLALRMVPVADGTDYGGSLRNPAGWNNIFGFRPGFGVVPGADNDVWLPSMSVTGPMARSVDDLARLLSVIAGSDLKAPLSATGDGRRFLAPLASDLKGKRIAWAGNMNGFVPYEPGVLELCETALKTFQSLGCFVEEANPDTPPEPVWQAFILLRQWLQRSCLAAYYADPTKRALMKPEAAWEVEGGLKLSAFDVTAASVTRNNWYAAVLRLFEYYDYWLMPTAQLFPFDVGETWPREICGHHMRTYHEWTKASCLISMSGCPALAIPAGFGPNGLPMGLQIVAAPGRDMDCLRLGFAYEQAAGLTKKYLPELLRQ